MEIVQLVIKTKILYCIGGSKRLFNLRPSETEQEPAASLKNFFFIKQPQCKTILKRYTGNTTVRKRARGVRFRTLVISNLAESPYV
jgi:hypothetical protein